MVNPEYQEKVRQYIGRLRSQGGGMASPLKKRNLRRRAPTVEPSEEGTEEGLTRLKDDSKRSLLLRRKQGGLNGRR